MKSTSLSDHYCCKTYTCSTIHRSYYFRVGEKVRVGIFYFLEGKLSSLMFWTALFSLQEAFIIMLFAIAYSLMTSTALAIIYSIITWIVGHSLSATAKILYLKSSTFFSTVYPVVTAVTNRRTLPLYCSVGWSDKKKIRHSPRCTKLF